MTVKLGFYGAAETVTGSKFLLEHDRHPVLVDCSCDKAPRRTFIVHAELDAAEALRVRVEDELRWTVEVPEYRDVELRRRLCLGPRAPRVLD